jgi:hypothetical protein
MAASWGKRQKEEVRRKKERQRGRALIHFCLLPSHFILPAMAAPIS